MMFIHRFEWLKTLAVMLFGTIVSSSIKKKSCSTVMVARILQGRTDISAV